MNTQDEVAFDHVWVWRQRWPTEKLRRGLRCRVLVRGSKNSVLLEMEDGEQVVTSRYAIRRVKTSPEQARFHF